MMSYGVVAVERDLIVRYAETETQNDADGRICRMCRRTEM